MKKYWFILVFGLFGCASNYMQPREGNTSELVFSKLAATHGGIMQSFAFAINDGSGCGKTYKMDDKDKENKYLVPAGKEIFVSFGLIQGSGYCTESVSFESEKNAIYKIDSSYGAWCGLSVSKQEVSGFKDIKVKKAYVDILAGRRICNTKKWL